MQLPSGPFPYYPVDQDLRDVLSQFGVHTGLAVSLSRTVHGRVTGPLVNDSADAFLAAITRRYGLDWTYDGKGLVFSQRSERESRVLDSRHATLEALKQILKEQGVYDDRYGLSAVDGHGGIRVDGPPRYVELVEQALRQSETVHAAEPPTVRAMTVIRGASISRKEF